MHTATMKKSFGIRNEGEVQGQSSPELTGILTALKCICCPSLEILTRIGGLDKLKMESILSLKLNLTLKVKVNCPPKQ